MKVLSIRVPKSLGEPVKQCLRKANRLDTRRKIMRYGEHLDIPIANIGKMAQNSLLSRFKRAQIVAQSSVNVSWKTEPFRSLIRKNLEKVLPPNLLDALPNRVRIFGHVAVIKLSDHLDHLKHTIGDAILRMYPGVRTVVNQRGPISGIYRHPQVEVISGNPVTETVHKEMGCLFKMDLSKTMFCPSNLNEKRRIIHTIDRNTVVIDMFAGIGQFSIPIALYARPKRIHAVELNPATFAYLVTNLELNGTKKTIVPSLGDSFTIINDRFTNIADHVVIAMPFSQDPSRFLVAGIRALKKNGILHYMDIVHGAVSFGAVFESVRTASAKCRRNVSDFSYKGIVKTCGPRLNHISIDASIA